jgi:hypothetical protein
MRIAIGADPGRHNWEMVSVLFGRRKRVQISPELTIEQVWKEFTQKPSDKSDNYHRTVYQNLQLFDPEASEGILNDLLQIETESMRQNDRLRYIREKIMDLVDRRAAAGNLRRLTRQDKNKNAADNEASDRRLACALADCNLQIAVLRAYAGGKFGDDRQDDWFSMYSYLSGFFHHRMLADAAGGAVGRFVFEGTQLDATKKNFQCCREKCLDAFVGQQFELPTDNSHRIIKLIRKIRRKLFWRKLIS